MRIIDINPADADSLDAALRTEWLLTNGLGGYAMGTALGVNTRRYHGLFIAATTPPVGRIVVLHSMIERFTLQDQTFDLSTQQFVDGDGRLILHPSGVRWLQRVAIEQPHRVRWTYRIGAVTLTRRLSLEPGVHRARIEYEVAGAPAGVAAEFRPFTPLRDFHALDREGHAQPRVAIEANRAIVERGGARVALIGHALLPESQWWRGFAYEQDRLRGQDWREDVWSPGAYAGEPRMNVIGSAGLVYELLDAPSPPSSAGSDSRTPVAPALSDAARPLAVAARSFVVARKLDGERWAASVIAGYPWFGDWGRDTMIALPGLMLCTGRLDDARSTLECFAKHLRNGLIPNLFDDYGGAAHYNTVDASLWFVHAVHALRRGHAAVGHDADPRDAGILAACREIVAAYQQGTDFQIRMDTDGLIVAGDRTTQLTWMDAARDGVVFTPRHGKAVEINALWHNALIALSEMTEDAGERNDLLMLARRVAASFRSAFWWHERQCLHDCLTPHDGAGAGTYLADGRLRPNQIFAVSLPFSPLNDAQRRAVVKVVGERLLTPFGLRTLDCDDTGYRPRYQGSLFERDAAYHNGTVWPWLIGPYCEALLRVEDFSDAAKKRVRQILQPLLDEMNSTSGGRCLGQIAEVYDGDAPHRPSGCPAQAWSVAEALRVLALVS